MYLKKMCLTKVKEERKEVKIHREFVKKKSDNGAVKKRLK